MYQKYFKRLFDFTVSFLAIVCVSPLFMVLSLLVYLNLGRPVLFRQKRPGKNERLFTLYKFRTLSVQCDKGGKLLPDGQRVTRFGNWLRSASLDELPQLVNILKGDMSFVGPRPLLASYLPYYTANERIRHTVRPGLTGMAQISGRNTLGWDLRLQNDLAYVKNVRLKTDIQIIWQTIGQVVRKKDVLDREQDRMPDLSKERSELYGNSSIQR
ncbi:MAG: sugar transferase [Eubacteriales bacterium]